MEKSDKVQNPSYSGIVKSIFDSGVSNNLLVKRKININKKEYLLSELQKYCNEIELIEKDGTKNLLQKKYLKARCERSYDVLYINAVLKKFKNIEDSELPIFLGRELKAFRNKTNGNDLQYKSYDTFYLLDKDEEVSQEVIGKQEHKKLPNEVDLSSISLIKILFPKVLKYILDLIEKENPRTWEQASNFINQNCEKIIQEFAKKREATTENKADIKSTYQELFSLNAHLQDLAKDDPTIKLFESKDIAQNKEGGKEKDFIQPEFEM